MIESTLSPTHVLPILGVALIALGFGLEIRGFRDSRSEQANQRKEAG